MEHGLINGSVAHEHWQIHPDEPLPLKASAIGQTNLKEMVYAYAQKPIVECGATKITFIYGASIEAYENNKLIYNRSLTDQISRDNL